MNDNEKPPISPENAEIIKNLNGAHPINMSLAENIDFGVYDLQIVVGAFISIDSALQFAELVKNFFIKEGNADFATAH
jgi:hypothetical protein